MVRTLVWKRSFARLVPQKRVEYKERMDAKAEARAELESERVAGVWTESVEYRKKLKEGKVDENIDMPNIDD